MNDIYLYVAVTIAALFVVVKIGLIIASSRQRETGYVIFFFLLLCAAVAAFFIPSATLFLAPYPFFIVLYENVPLFVAILFFFSALTTIDNRNSARALYFLGVFIALISLSQTLLFGFPVSIEKVTYPNAEDVLIQSTSDTCVAAAAAILLNTLDIRASEQTMTELTFTRHWRGANMLGAYHGLVTATRNTPSEGKVRIEIFNIEKLQTLGTPVLLFVNRSFPVTHAVIIESFDDGLFTINDPLSGRYMRSTLELESMWSNPIGIYIEP